jgi:hypothetical protein
LAFQQGARGENILHGCFTEEQVLRYRNPPS